MSKSWKQINEGKAKFWQEHIDRWGTSDISQVEYCRRNNLRPHRFTYWKIKFSKHNLPMEIVQAPVPVHIHQAGLKLNIGRELQVEIPDGFQKETLEQVLLALKVVS